jgi:hypothetical protein
MNCSVRIFTIHLGSNSLQGSDPYAVKVSADTYVLHPDYNIATLDNDIGLIWLREPVPFSGKIANTRFTKLLMIPYRLSETCRLLAIC